MQSTGFKIDNGWTYSFDPNEPVNKRLKVIPKEGTLTPEYLYKYYSLSHLNIDAVKKNYLYASGRFEINDEFDCMEQFIDMKTVSDQFIVDFYLQFEHVEQEIRDDIDSFRVSLPLHKAIDYYGGYGVVSLCDNIDSPTMWAHYARNEGFAIKFNLNHFHEKMLGPYPVNYKENWYPLKLEEVGESLAFLYMTNIKSIHWQYEKEWRYIATGRNMSFPRFRDDEQYVNNRKFEYSLEAIEEIILGIRFIHGINKYGNENTLILANTPDLTNGKEKLIYCTLSLKTILKHQDWFKKKEVKLLRLKQNLFKYKRLINIPL